MSKCNQLRNSPHHFDIREMIQSTNSLTLFHLSRPAKLTLDLQAQGKVRTHLTNTMRQWDTYRRPVRPYGREKKGLGVENACQHTHTHIHTPSKASRSIPQASFAGPRSTSLLYISLPLPHAPLKFTARLSCRLLFGFAKLSAARRIYTERVKF